MKGSLSNAGSSTVAFGMYLNAKAAHQNVPGWGQALSEF